MPEKVTMFRRRTAVGVGGVVGAVVLLVGLVTPASAATGTTALYGPGVTNYVDAGVQGLSCHDFGADNDFYTNINNAANGGIYIYLDKGCNPGGARRLFAAGSGYQSLGGLAGKASSYQYTS